MLERITSGRSFTVVPEVGAMLGAKSKSASLVLVDGEWISKTFFLISTKNKKENRYCTMMDVDDGL